MRIRARSTLFLAALSLAVVATPGLCQEAPASPTITLEGAAVPYTVRAEALFSGLAQLHAEDLERGDEGVADFMRTLGIVPDSAAAHELVDLATGLEREHPAVSAETKARAKAGIDIDLESRGGWMDQRYAKVGHALGEWLANRRAEGWAIEPLLDRLLNGSHLGVSVYSDESKAALMERIDRQSAAMVETLEIAFGEVPRQFAQRQERSLR